MEPDRLKTIILCGGLGTRLREETEYRPKPLVEIGGKPILWHIMKLYAHYGLRDFVLCLGYRGQMIKEYFLNYEAMNNDFTVCLGKHNAIVYHEEHREQDYNVTLVDTGLETMTGGRIRRAGKFLEQQTFMVTYGDGVADINIAALLEYHRSHGKLATISTMRPSSRFGVMDIDAQGMVSRFVEKPQLDGWASCGFFVFEPPVLDFLNSDSCVLEREPLERLAAEGQLAAFQHPGFFHAMDSYREYLSLNELWDSGHAPWKVWS